ncbi:hypothetical protein B4U80_12923 [Leptotrombidium deliense]|uniref:GH16 domain-containing protein n=1 Tax=Leptotrombidium deliense TaxID=299467 RepID=A0A443SH90_9ACAR|nr:hypothetical protein B4U80_12923 [Leptotrombidium deliense]
MCYTNRSENVRVVDGHLIIEAKLEKFGNKNYTSGRIQQVTGLRSFGAFVFRAKLPDGLFLFPSLWTESLMLCKYSEIDVIQFNDSQQDEFKFSASFGRDLEHLKQNTTIKQFANVNFSTEFHEFAILWSEKSIRWFVDKEQVFEVSTRESDWVQKDNKPCTANQKPFDEIASITMNIDVRGNDSQNEKNETLTPNIDGKWVSPRLVVDWIRIYQN